MARAAATCPLVTLCVLTIPAGRKRRRRLCEVIPQQPVPLLIALTGNGNSPPGRSPGILTTPLRQRRKRGLWTISRPWPLPDWSRINGISSGCGTDTPGATNFTLSFPAWIWQAAGILTPALLAGGRILTYSVISIIIGKAGRGRMIQAGRGQGRRIMPTCTEHG